VISVSAEDIERIKTLRITDGDDDGGVDLGDASTGGINPGAPGPGDPIDPNGPDVDDNGNLGFGDGGDGGFGDSNGIGETDTDDGTTDGGGGDGNAEVPGQGDGPSNGGNSVDGEGDAPDFVCENESDCPPAPESPVDVLDIDLGDFLTAGTTKAFELACFFNEEYEKAICFAQGIADRQIEISKALEKCYCDIDYPNALEAACAAIACEVPVPDCNEMGVWANRSRQEIRKVKNMERRLQDRLCVRPTNIRCDNEYELLQQTITLDAAKNKFEYAQRREEQMWEYKLAALSRSKNALNVSPGPMLNALNTAQGIWQGLASSAAQGFNGATSLIGYNLGSLSNLFGDS